VQADIREESSVFYCPAAQLLSEMAWDGKGHSPERSGNHFSCETGHGTDCASGEPWLWQAIKYFPLNLCVGFIIYHIQIFRK